MAVHTYNPSPIPSLLSPLPFPRLGGYTARCDSRRKTKDKARKTICNLTSAIVQSTKGIPHERAFASVRMEMGMR
jgi:hypothetical protein